MAVSILLGFEARLAKTDAVLLVCILGSIGFLARAYLGHAIGWTGAFGFWIALAAGIVVKGPLVAMVVGSTALVLCVVERSAVWLKVLRPLPGVALMLLLALPWYIAIGIVSGGEFFSIAFGKNFLGKVGAGEQGHGAPPGFHLVLFWAVFWPAAGLVLMAAPWIWQNRRTDAVKFCLAWIIPTWIVFELVATKLPHYVLPVYPAISILIVMALLSGRRPSTLLAVLIAIGALIYALAGPVLLFVAERQIAWAALPVSFAGFALAVWGVRVAKSSSVAAYPTVLAVSAILIHAATFGLVLPRMESVWLAPRIAEAVKRQARCPKPEVVSAGFAEASLVFSVGTKIQLTFGEPAAAFLVAGGCRVALIDQPQEQEFLQALSQQSRTAELRERIEGFSVGGGRRHSVGVYVLK
jgi:4-amino-4-deoxy-L-arabinose transferase-like glycosyltransferase